MNEAAGDVFVKDDDAFNQTTRELGGVADTFQGGAKTAITATAAPAGPGEMAEGQEFFTVLGTAGTKLADFLSTVADGLAGYRSAVGSIGYEYNKLVVLNNQRLQTVLRPHEGPVDPINTSA